MDESEAKSNKSGMQEWRQALSEAFGDDDIRVLCFDLEIDYHEISGKTKSNKIASLLTYMRRHQRLVELVEYCTVVRPNVDWEKFLENYGGGSEKNRLELSRQQAHSESFRKLYQILVEVQHIREALYEFFQLAGHLDRTARLLNELGMNSRTNEQKNYTAHRLAHEFAQLLGGFQLVKGLDITLFEFSFSSDLLRGIEDQIVAVEQVLSDLGLYREYQKQCVELWQESRKVKSQTKPFVVNWGALEPMSPWALKVVDEFLEGAPHPVYARKGVPEDIDRYCWPHSLGILCMSDLVYQLTLGLFELLPNINELREQILGKCKELNNIINN